MVILMLLNSRVSETIPNCNWEVSDGSYKLMQLDIQQPSLLYPHLPNSQ